jgi:hypothetical protein
MERELKIVPRAKLHVIPASVDTRPWHPGVAKVDTTPLQELLQARLKLPNRVRLGEMPHREVPSR